MDHKHDETWETAQDPEENSRTWVQNLIGADAGEPQYYVLVTHTHEPGTDKCVGRATIVTNMPDATAVGEVLTAACLDLLGKELGLPGALLGHSDDGPVPGMYL